MKNTFLIGLSMAAALAAATLRAQIYTPSGAVNTSLGSGGNVGIGEDTPESVLHVKGNDGTLLFIEPDAAATIQGAWTYPESLLSIYGLSQSQSISGPPSFEETFKVGVNGRTQIGWFPQSPSNRLAVRDDIGVYSNTNTWLQLEFPSNRPTISWKAGGNNPFRIRNDETGITALSVDKDGKTGFGTSAFAGDQILRVEGGSLHDKLWVQKTEDWGQSDEFIQLKLDAGPEVKWESSTNDILRFHGNGFDVMLLSSEGKVGVGKDFVPSYFLGSNHSLYVKGSAVAEEIFVRLKADWGDFVFEESYDLMPLKELDSYLKQNKHLPDFPSAAEVKENGLALGETERLLTIKVEELTLYLLEMNKEMEALREEITTLKSKK